MKIMTLQVLHGAQVYTVIFFEYKFLNHIEYPQILKF